MEFPLRSFVEVGSRTPKVTLPPGLGKYITALGRALNFVVLGLKAYGSFSQWLFSYEEFEVGILDSHLSNVLC